MTEEEFEDLKNRVRRLEGDKGEMIQEQQCKCRTKEGAMTVKVKDGKHYCPRCGGRIDYEKGNTILDNQEICKKCNCPIKEELDNESCWYDVFFSKPDNPEGFTQGKLKEIKKLTTEYGSVETSGLPDGYKADNPAEVRECEHNGYTIRNVCTGCGKHLNKEESDRCCNG